MLHKNLILISRKILKQIISEFILEHSTNTILDRVNISKYKLLKILTLIRIEMAKAIQLLEYYAETGKSGLN